MNVKIEPSWQKQLNEEFKKPYFEQLAHFVREEYKFKRIFPPASLLFNAFNCTPFEQVKAVILGQDPYHGEGQAHGLSFSVNEGIVIPPSLKNIFKELNADLGIPVPTSGNLQRWANQGVLLLNATLTVEAHCAGSHQNKGWEQFTDAAIQILAEKQQHLVFLFWGAYAQKKAHFIDNQKHLLLQSVHPSPLSAHRGFLGCKHFSQANAYLKTHNIEEIEW